MFHLNRDKATTTQPVSGVRFSSACLLRSITVARRDDKNTCKGIYQQLKTSETCSVFRMSCVSPFNHWVRFSDNFRQHKTCTTTMNISIMNSPKDKLCCHFPVCDNSFSRSLAFHTFLFPHPNWLHCGTELFKSCHLIQLLSLLKIVYSLVLVCIFSVFCFLNLVVFNSFLSPE